MSGFADDDIFDLNPEGVIETDSGIAYGVSEARGFLFASRRNNTWEIRNSGLPGKIIYPFVPEEISISVFENIILKNLNSVEDKKYLGNAYKKGLYGYRLAIKTGMGEEERLNRIFFSVNFRPGNIRKITSFSVDPVNDSRVAVTFASELYISEDRGMNWERISTSRPIGRNTYFTSVALSPHDGNSMIIGTSFEGFFETRDRGKTWKRFSEDANILYKGQGFFEEISAVSYSMEDPRVVFIAYGFGGGVYESSETRKVWTRIAYPGLDETDSVLHIFFRKRGLWDMEIRTKNNIWKHTGGKKKWVRIKREKNVLVPDLQKMARKRKAGDKYGIYVSSFMASGDYLDEHIKLIKKYGFNSMVVDMKDDSGKITYNTSLKLPYAMGAVRKRINLQDLLKTARTNNIYLIGRIVVFQDEMMYRYKNNKYSVWNSAKKKPWGKLYKTIDEKTGEVSYFQKQYWVDPFSRFVWDYNVSLARELQEAGIDEIQFDYIRFPTHGVPHSVVFRYKRKNMNRIDALESFLKMARESISIPISTDVFGFHGWFRLGNVNGQNIEMFSKYVDVISPMFYPSHFKTDFIRNPSYLDWSKNIYKIGTERASFMVEGRCEIRPYIQAFRLGSETKFDRVKSAKYLTKQLEGSTEADSSGFTLWNASNDYYMIYWQPSTLDAYLKKKILIE